MAANIEREFQDFIKSSFPDKPDASSAQYRDLRFAFFGGALSSLEFPKHDVAREMAAFFAKLAKDGMPGGRTDA